MTKKRLGFRSWVAVIFVWAISLLMTGAFLAAAFMRDQDPVLRMVAAAMAILPLLVGHLFYRDTPTKRS